MADTGRQAGASLPAAARRLVELVAEHPDGVTRTELAAAAQGRFAGLHPRRIADLVSRAVEADALREEGVRLRIPGTSEKEFQSAEVSGAAPARPVRAVALDLEAVVRTTASAPFLDKRIFQVGAVRFGTDVAWVAAEPRREWFVQLPDETWEIRSASQGERHRALAIAPARALLELQAFTADSDMVVTYNGTEADFPLLAAAYERESLPTLTSPPVDAYYLALAIWPTADRHRLAELADAVGVDRSELGWHDAGDDAELLVRLADASR